MPRNEIRNPKYLDDSNSLYQVIRRASVDNADALEDRYGCTIDVIRPNKWLDGGTDQYWVHGRYIISRLEFKQYPRKLGQRYYWNTVGGIPSQCGSVSLQIRPQIATDSVDLSEMDNLRCGDSSDGHVFSGSRRGCIYFVVYPKCYSSLCVVNFTGSRFYRQLDDRLDDAVKRKDWTTHKKIQDCARDVIANLGRVVQPIHSQFEWFLSEGFVRQDVDTVYSYIMNGKKHGALRLRHDGDTALLEYLRHNFQHSTKSGLADVRKHWFCRMMYRLECIRHIDSLLTADGVDRYNQYVDAVRKQTPLEYLAKLKDKDCRIPDVRLDDVPLWDDDNDND